jgi:hypothetical protein
MSGVIQHAPPPLVAKKMSIQIGRTEKSNRLRFIESYKDEMGYLQVLRQ